MDDLLKKLQVEAGLSEEQSLKALSIIKDQMEHGNVDVDWDKFFKGRYDDFLGKAKEAFGGASEEASKFADKLSDKADDFADSAKSKLKDLSQKAVDYFDGDDDKK